MLLRVSAVFFSLLSLKYITYSFFLSALSVPSLLPCVPSVPLLHSPGARPSVSLSPPSSLPSACPPLLLSVVCAVAAVCLLLCSAVFCCVPFRLPVPVSCPVLSSVCAPLKLYRRPSVCPAVCRAAAVTRQPSGVRQYDSVGRCTAYISPAFCPLAYVLPLSVPWLPSVRPCVCPAACCRLVAVIGGTPLYPGRRRCGAASAM